MFISFGVIITRNVFVGGLEVVLIEFDVDVCRWFGEKRGRSDVPIPTAIP